MPCSMTKRILIITIILLYAIASAHAQTGTWSGKLDIQGTKLSLVFNLDGDQPTMDSPDQGVKGIPAQVERDMAGKIVIKVPSLAINYEGLWQDNKIEGTFTQMYVSLPLTLVPGEDKPNRPQTPAAPFPYATEEVSFANGDYILNGTLTLPAGLATDEKVKNTLATTTKAYITGTTSATTNTGTQVFDTGVYLDTTAGRLTSGSMLTTTCYLGDTSSYINKTNYTGQAATVGTLSGYVVDSCASADASGVTAKALSANQGYLLQNQITTLNSNVPFKFGVDSSGNYGYIKAGADTVTPFLTRTGNATESHVLSGYTFSNASSSGLTGSMTNNGAKTASLNCGGSYTIPAGYHNGSGKVTANSLSSQTSATATASNIEKGKTAYVNGVKITGTLVVYTQTQTGSIVVCTNLDGQNSASSNISFKEPFTSTPSVTGTATSSVSEATNSLSLSFSSITTSGCKVTVKNNQEPRGYNAKTVTVKWTAKGTNA